MRRARASFALATLVALLTLTGPVVADVADPDVCLAVRTEGLPAEAWPAIIAAVDAATATEARPQLFPERTREVLLGEPGTAAVIMIRAAGPDGEMGPACDTGNAAWVARISRTFLSDGADRMLAAAPTTPGIDSDVVVEWYPDESRVRTWLAFEGPLGIPNGTCWIDDELWLSGDVAATTAQRGLKTSPFAESACGRFFDHLTRGGAGEQAITLLPDRVSLADGSAVVFVAEAVEVADDAIELSGSLDVR